MKETIHCLLIDDDKDDQEIFLLALEETGLKIDCYCETNAADALDRLEEQAELPDLIFLDVNMPRISGKELLVTLKHTPRLSQIPVVMCSTSADETEIKECYNSGATDYIVKSPSLLMFSHVLARCLTLLMHSSS